jgi:ABC-type multidrug transport system fused ATPase/permease subunit
MQGVARLLGRHGMGLYAAGVAASLVLSGLEYVIAFFLVGFMSAMGFAPDAIMPAWWPLDADAFSSVGAWALLMAVCVLRAGATIAAYHTKMLLTERTNARFKMLLGHIILKQDAPFPMSLSRINFYMTECFPKATSFVFLLAQMTSFCIQAATMIVLMFSLAWGESLIGLGGLALMGGLVLYLNRFTNRIAARVPDAGQCLETTKLRVVRNWILIKVLRMQDVEHAKLLDAVRRYYRDSVLAFLFAHLGGAIMPVLGVVILASMVVAHFRLFETPPSDFIAFLYLFVRLEQRLGNGSNLLGGLFTYRPQFEESLGLVMSLEPRELDAAFEAERHFSLRSPGRAQIPPLGQDSTTPPATRREKPDKPPHIRCEGITFSWPGRTEPVISNLFLDIPAGSQVGIVGPNGVGKSTLLGILLGIYAPTRGRLAIDGRHGAEYFERYSDAIAYVGPEPYLIQGSILDNLTYGLHETPNEDSVRQALRTVHLDAFVDTLPGGTGYIIREDGHGLSSGQKQRLTIARAFLRQPSLLVLDEPSANLDESTEAAVLETLGALKGHCTVVIVSHRQGILRDVDQTLEMDPAPLGGD